MSDSGRAWVRKAATVILLLSGMSDAPTAAAARPPQGLPREPEVQGYRQAGPLFYQAALRVKAFGYDDNVFLDRDHPQGGIVGTLGPELLGVVRLGPQVWVSLHGGVDFTGYSRQPS